MATRAKLQGEFLINEAVGSAKATLVLAHGAGAAMDPQPLTYFAEYFAAQKICVVRFEFPYMRLRREDGRKRGPDTKDVLLQSWRNIIEQFGGGAQLIIGGKSMGGRIASMVADETGARGLVCLGYPFHPSGKPAQLRVSHLKTLKTPTLIAQGERDPFGGTKEVAGYPLSGRIRIFWVPDGDHSFKPRTRSGRTESQNLEEVSSQVVSFISGLE